MLRVRGHFQRRALHCELLRAALPQGCLTVEPRRQSPTLSPSLSSVLDGNGLVQAELSRGRRGHHTATPSTVTMPVPLSKVMTTFRLPLPGTTTGGFTVRG